MGNKLENKRGFARLLKENEELVVTNRRNSEEFKFVDSKELLRDLLAGAFSLIEEISADYWLCKYEGSTDLVKIEVI